MRAWTKRLSTATCRSECPAGRSTCLCQEAAPLGQQRDRLRTETSMTTHLATENAATDMHPFLSATEVGQQLGLGKSRVYALAAEGLIPTVRLGRRIWFPRRGLDALADAAIERAEERIAGSAHLIH